MFTRYPVILALCFAVLCLSEAFSEGRGGEVIQFCLKIKYCSPANWRFRMRLTMNSRQFPNSRWIINCRLHLIDWRGSLMKIRKKRFRRMNCFLLTSPPLPRINCWNLNWLKINRWNFRRLKLKSSIQPALLRHWKLWKRSLRTKCLKKSLPDLKKLPPKKLFRSYLEVL